MKTLVFLAAITILGACGDKKERVYAYEINENSCSTNAHRFDTLVEYCQALKDDVLNNGCAWSTRVAYYQRDCGTDWVLRDSSQQLPLLAGGFQLFIPPSATRFCRL